MQCQRIGHLFLLLLFLIGNNSLWADTAIDSLKLQLESELDPTTRVNLLNELSMQLRRVQPAESVQYAKEALNLANQNDLSLEKVTTLLNFAFNYLIKGALDTAMMHVDESLELARTFNSEPDLADVYQMKGLVYQLEGKYADALINYHDALIINEKLNRESRITRQLNNMAIVRRELKDYKLALELLNKQRTIAERINGGAMLMACDGNIGYVYLDLEEFEKALPFIQSAVRRGFELKDSLGIAFAKNLLADCHLGLEQRELAFKHAQEGLMLSQAIEYRDGIVYSKYLIAEYYFYLQDYDKAIFFAEEAVDLIGDQVTNRDLARLLTILVKSHKVLGKQSLAFQYQDQLLRVKEAIFNKESDNLTYRLEADAQLRNKEREKETLKREIEVGKELISQQRLLNILAICLVVLVIIICVLLYLSLLRNRRQKAQLEAAVSERTSELSTQNKKLQQSNKELESFAYIASHDLKEPIRNINSFSHLALRAINNNDSAASLEYLDYVAKSTKQINSLIDGILRYSLLWTEPSAEKVDLNETIQALRIKLKSTLTEKNVQLIVDDLPVIQANPTEMSQLFGNLIENGIKYNQSEVPTIKVTCQDELDQYTFSISDNGIGIEEAYHETIFKMFKRLHHFYKYAGTGLGLAIVKRIIEKMNGKIWIQSTPNEGTTFHFSIPKAKRTLKKDIVLQSTNGENDLHT